MFKKILVANRGEIALRIIRACRELNIKTVAIYSKADELSLHTKFADEAICIGPAESAKSYLNMAAVISAAELTNADAIHPGYGFLAENADFARALETKGITFVGPLSEQLALFGDKLSARNLATRLDVPVVAATPGAATLEEVEEFLAEHGAVMVKAVAGGGGRGMREVRQGQDVASIFERCQSEAQSSFGIGDLYAEKLIEAARHIEVQIIGDGSSVAHLGERECTLQRQNQKIIEVAPSPSISAETRAVLTDAATKMAGEVGYLGLGTWEFLVDANDPTTVAFIETNARLQVEHTVTEEITGVDLVRSQILIAGGASLADLRLQQTQAPVPKGFAIQCRVNTETMTEEGLARPAGGTISAFETPSGPGVRTDSYGYQGYPTNPNFDSLIAKVIGYSPTSNYEDAVRRVRRALSEFRIEGVSTNITYLLALLDRQEVRENTVTTGFINIFASELVEAAQLISLDHWSSLSADEASNAPLAGAQVSSDPLAVLQHGDIDQRQTDNSSAKSESSSSAGPDGTQAVEAPLQGTIISLSVSPGDEVAMGQPVAVMEAMKMEHVISADHSGNIRRVTLAVGDIIREGYPLFFIETSEGQTGLHVAINSLLKIIESCCFPGSSKALTCRSRNSISNT